jgi:hypothetical protein
MYELRQLLGHGSSSATDKPQITSAPTTTISNGARTSNGGTSFATVAARVGKSHGGKTSVGGDKGKNCIVRMSTSTTEQLRFRLH